MSALILVLVPWQVGAQTVYSDGANHTVTGPSGPILVENAPTSLTIDSPADITNVGFPAYSAVNAGPGTTVNMLGGMVSGGVILDGGFFGGFGGAVIGGDYVNGVGGSIFGLAADGGSVAIFGGTYSGGNVFGSQVQGGVGLDATTGQGGGSITIFGGTFIGGDGTGTQIGDGGIGAAVDGNFSISGGVFQGGTGNTLITGPSLEFGGFGASGSISGGTFSNGVGFYLQNGQVDISGGNFAGSWGGQLEPGSSLNFYGSGLSWTPMGPGQGQLAGTLADGSPLNVGFWMYDPFAVSLIVGPNGEELSFTPVVSGVPEPASLVSLSLGILGVAIACKSRWVRRRLSAGQPG